MVSVTPLPSELERGRDRERERGREREKERERELPHTGIPGRHPQCVSCVSVRFRHHQEIDGWKEGRKGDGGGGGRGWGVKTLIREATSGGEGN